MRRGFSLMEMLVAGALFSTIFYALISIYPSSLMGMRKGHDLISATNIAQQILDQQRDLRFDLIADGAFAQPDQTIDGTLFHSQLVVTSRHKTLKDIQAVVTWTASQASENAPATSVTLQTTLYDFKNP